MTKKRSLGHKSRENKKAIVMNRDKKRPIPIVIGALVVMAAAAGLSLFLFSGDRTSTLPIPPTASDGRISYAISLFDDGKAHHFDFADPESNTTIKYFILKSSDGVIRAAFDACDVCWTEGKGYVQDGSAMICRNCGRRFESVMINDVKGGCNPAPLKRSIEADQLVIRVEDLKKGHTYFNFSKKA